jgi:hypothetical protein
MTLCRVCAMGLMWPTGLRWYEFVRWDFRAIKRVGVLSVSKTPFYGAPRLQVARVCTRYSGHSHLIVVCDVSAASLPMQQELAKGLHQMHDICSLQQLELCGRPLLRSRVGKHRHISSRFQIESARNTR